LPAETTKPVLLLVDDDRLLLLTVANGLRKSGYEVLEASSATEAITLCESHTPDLAIFDIRMPGMGGIEAAQELASKYELPFIIFSAYCDESLIDQAIEHGALSYLTKPLDMTQLIPVIEVALQRAKDIKSLKDMGFHLNRALSTGRDTSTAVGILMERFHVTSDDAFELLRSYARTNRRKVADIAAELRAATDQLNQVGKQ
jgi:AmiR/NasT family two-component response regulator